MKRFAKKRSLQYIVVVLALTLIAGTCDDKQEKTCNTDNPLEEIEWLKQIKMAFDMDMGMSRKQIIQYRYNNQDVFLINRCEGCPNAHIVVYDCEKNLVCEFGGEHNDKPCPDFEEKATNKKVLYDQ